MPCLPLSRIAALMACLAVSWAHAAEPIELDPEPAGPWKVNCPPAPLYPLAALKDRAEGTTAVRLTFGANGVVSNAAVARRSGETPSHAKLDAAAVKALKRCRLEGTIEGKPPEFMRTVVWEVDVPTPRRPATAASEAGATKP